MAKRKFWLGMLILVSVLGMSKIGCASTSSANISGPIAQTEFTIPVPTVNTIEPRLRGESANTVERHFGRQLIFESREESTCAMGTVIITQFLLENYPDQNSNTLFGFTWDRFAWYEIRYDLNKLGITDKQFFLQRTVVQFERTFGSFARRSEWAENRYSWRGPGPIFPNGSVSVSLETDRTTEHTLLIVSVWFSDAVW